MKATYFTVTPYVTQAESFRDHSDWGQVGSDFSIGSLEPSFLSARRNIAPAKLIGRICQRDDIASVTLKSDWEMNNLEF